MLPLLHFLLKISVLTPDRVEITIKFLNISILLVKVKRTILELIANTIILLIELIDILLFGI